MNSIYYECMDLGNVQVVICVMFKCVTQITEFDYLAAYGIEGHLLKHHYSITYYIYFILWKGKYGNKFSHIHICDTKWFPWCGITQMQQSTKNIKN